MARFRREAMIGYHLGRFEGFVSAFDWGKLDATRLYLAMDLVPHAKPLDLQRDPKRALHQLLAAARPRALA